MVDRCVSRYYDYKQLFLSILLFPEYNLYRLRLRTKNAHERDALYVFAITWIILKIALIIGAFLYLLTPYIVQWKYLIPFIFLEISMLTILTLTFYIKISKKCIED